MRHLLILFVSIYIFTGCAVQKPDVPKYNVKKTDKIGYFIKSNDKMLHTHVGTTVFNNFEKKYPKQLDKKLVENLLKENIGVELVDLSKFKYEDIKNLIVAKDKNWMITDEELYSKFAKELNLKAILLVEETRTVAQAGMYFYEAKSSGLLTSSLLGMHRYFAISGFDYSLYLLNPIGEVKIDNVQKFKIIYDPMLSRYQEESGFKKIKSFKKISKEELSILEKNTIKLTKENISKINDYLSK